MLLKYLARQLFQNALFILWLLNAYSAQAQVAATSLEITSENVALVVNDADPSSVLIADYYQSAHNIPEQNIIHAILNPSQAKLSRKAFESFSDTLNSKLLPSHQAVLFLWSAPYQVECQSLTSVFTLGFDPNLCVRTCAPSQANPYFNKPNNRLANLNNMRLSMLLPTSEIEVAMSVIDRGVISREGVFKSTAYYLKTDDKARNSRAHFFPKNGLSFKGTGLTVVNKQENALIDVRDIMIYQIGAAHVKYLPTLNFLPGALADHLTSFGGQLKEGGQMSVLAWLRAGATASYGTVSEPCNYWQKFPNPSVLLRWYVAGDTAIEAYWKSVAWPSQGLFVGDPLAKPFAKPHYPGSSSEAATLAR